MNFSDLVGMTMLSVEQIGDDVVRFTSCDDRIFELFHAQDCCEIVEIESIVGDLSDLAGVPILLAEEMSSEETPSDYVHEYEPESQTWTFYKLRTIKGSVDIRWFGSSNGYYSESVDFEEVDIKRV